MPRAPPLGFAREEAARIPLDAPERCYADPNPKPELVCALGAFEALCGFRELARSLRERDPALGARALRCAARARPEAATRPATSSRRLLRLPEGERRAIAAELAGCAARAGRVRRPRAGWVSAPPRRVTRATSRARRRSSSTTCASRAGEALHLRPGDLHGYLAGTALEVMASSDNVLRAGLTPKHVDVEELLRRAEPGADRPAARRAQRRRAGRGGLRGADRVVPPRAAPRRAAAPLRLEVRRGAEVLLCLEGAGELAAADAPDGPCPSARGEALFVTGETPRYEMRGEARLARASSGL